MENLAGKRSNEVAPSFKATNDIFSDKEMISKMLERLKKLLNSFSVQRSLAVNFIEQQEIIQLVELRVVREFNLPDNYVNILRVSLLLVPSMHSFATKITI